MIIDLQPKTFKMIQMGEKKIGIHRDFSKSRRKRRKAVRKSYKKMLIVLLQRLLSMPLEVQIETNKKIFVLKKKRLISIQESHPKHQRQQQLKDNYRLKSDLLPLQMQQRTPYHVICLLKLRQLVITKKGPSKRL